MDIKRIVLTAISVGLVTVGSAQETFYWTGGSGTWSDVANWSMNSSGTTPATRYPGAVTNTVEGVDYAATDDVVLFAPTATGTVTLDVDVSIWRFSVQASTTATSMIFESADAGNPCTLTMTTTTSQSIGDDTSIRDKRTVTFRNIKLRCVSLDFRGGNGVFDTGADVAKAGGSQMTMLAWQEDRTIRYLDGCTVKATLEAKRQRATHQIEGGTIIGKIAPESMYCTIRISGGTCNFSSGVTLSQNSTIDISGGNVSMSSLNLSSNATAVVSGGSVSMASMKLPATATAVISGGDITSSAMPNINADAAFIFTNGTLTVTADATTTDRRLLGAGDAVFRSTVDPTANGGDYKKKPSISVITNDNDTITCATLFATNANYSAFHCNYSATVFARTINARRFTINAVRDVTLKADRLNLGTRLYPTVDGASLVIPDGITLGAFGDWYVYDKKFSLCLGGPISCDTTDCFDGETARTIGLYKVLTLPDASLDVLGCGTVNLETFGTSASTNRLNRIHVGTGATLTMTNSARGICMDNLTLDSGSTLRLRAGKGAFDVLSASIDPAANILVQVPTGLTYQDFSAVVAPDDETAAAIAERMTLDGNDAENWSVVSGPRTAYVSSKSPTDFGAGATSSNIWTGAVNGNWSVPGNWTSESVPRANNYNSIQTTDVVYFGRGTSYVTNDFSETYLQRMFFLATCRPIVISGNYIRLKSSTAAASTTGNSIYSVSRFPVIIESEVYHGSTLSVTAARDSYVALNGRTRSVDFCLSGEVRIGGLLSCQTLRPQAPTGSNGRITSLHVTDGGFVAVANQAHNFSAIHSRMVVDGGGALVFSNKTGSAVFNVTSGLTHPSRINGLLDVQCPYRASHDMYYTGTGTVQLASVQSTNVSAAVILGGGLTIKPKSWTTVTTDAPDNYIKISVTNSAILSAAANWTYGPEAGVATTTTAAERALEIADRATLTVRTDGYTVSFADPIVGKGNLVIAEGSKVALAGDLFASAKTSWTTFATVGSFSAAPGTIPEYYRVRTVENGDGTVSVQAKLVHGFIFSFR